MNLTSIGKLALLALGLFIFSACTKNDLETNFTMTINGKEIKSNPVAAYCEQDSITYISISNKQENLYHPRLDTVENSMEGDFVLCDGLLGDSFHQIFMIELGESFTGIPTLTRFYYKETEMTFEIINDFVVGSSTGVLIGDMYQNADHIELPYTMNCIVEIVERCE